MTYFPFLTARVIADGPGLDYLDRHCPDAAIPACALHAALALSDNPMRLTASHIVFETSPELGSFRRMSRDDQRRVVEDEMNFARAVVLNDPLGRRREPVAQHAGAGAPLNSVEMTIPKPEDVVGAGKLFPEAGLDRGRLIADLSWLPVVETVHDLVYLLSLAVTVLLLVWPRRVAWQIRLFALAILAGILANAFVCGAVSQPANRYGARVIWLLPLLATTMTLFAWPGRHRTGNRR